MGLRFPDETGLFLNRPAPPPIVTRIVRNSIQPPSRGGWILLPRWSGDAHLVRLHHFGPTPEAPPWPATPN